MKINADWIDTCDVTDSSSVFGPFLVFVSRDDGTWIWTKIIKIIIKAKKERDKD